MGLIEARARFEPETPKLDVLRDRLNVTIDRGRAALLAKRRPDGSWDHAANLGTHFLAQYWLCLRWLDVAEPRLDAHYLADRLLAAQKADGSWRQLEDAADGAGDLNPTIFNYWFLKAWSAGTPSPQVERALARARAYVLANGGIERSALFTKTFLALFGEYSWSRLLRVPYAIFVEKLPLNYRSFSQWTIPHLMAIAFLRANRAVRKFGDEFAVRELWRRPEELVESKARRPDPVFDRFLIEKILDRQQPKGSWGGYTSATLLTAMALRHASAASFGPLARMDAAASRGLGYVADLYLGGAGPYLGCTMDGHFWDTLLCANALAASGASTETIEPSAAYMRAVQQDNGGFPYGFDFEYAPDVDDTAEAAFLLARIDGAGDRDRAGSAIRWLRSMQNADGGWGAFDRDNVGGPILRRFARAYEDSVDLFDDSSADCTGHVLDALAAFGMRAASSAHVRRGVAYLRKTQDAQLGGWEGRWGVNWIFGTSCALLGLAAAGVAPDDSVTVKALQFMLSRQNRDGGFGETPASYRDRGLAARGPSSPTQTAWVLRALCANGWGRSPEAARAANWLVDALDPQLGTWRDPFPTGTGHPGVVYMNYPSYAEAFPLMALAAYRRASGEGFRA